MHTGGAHRRARPSRHARCAVADRDDCRAADRDDLTGAGPHTRGRHAHSEGKCADTRDSDA